MAIRVICNIKSCKHRTIRKLAGRKSADEFGGERFCDCETIHLQGCTPDADNVVACSEFLEEDS